MKLSPIIGQVGMVKLSIRSAIRRIRLSPPQSPPEAVISNRSPLWKLLAEALEGSPLATTGAHRKITVAATKLTQSEIPIRMSCTILHGLTRHHLLVEMVRALKHQLPEATELMDVHQLIHLFLPHRE